MGYTTDFYGEFKLDKALTPEHKEYLIKFSETRRMKRNELLTKDRPDPVREAVGLPVGHEGEYFVGEDGFMGQEGGDDVINYNCPSSTQPGLWCKWVPTDDDVIEWDYGEKFYDYEEWLQYIIDNFLIPWGYVLNGEVEWQGEDREDMGKLVVTDNVLTVLHGYIDYR